MAAAEPAKSAEEVKEAKRAGGKKGGNGRAVGTVDSTEPTAKVGGHSTPRLAARLKRDFPEIAAAVERASISVAHLGSAL